MGVRTCESLGFKHLDLNALHFPFHRAGESCRRERERGAYVSKEQVSLGS